MPTLEATELDLIRRYYDQTHGLVVAATNGLTEAQWRFKPAPDRWSIAENLEHMVTVQERILGPVAQALLQAPAPPADRDLTTVEKIILERVPDRSLRANAPEPLQPSGKFTPAEALERLTLNHHRLVEFVEKTPDLRAHELESAPLRFVTGGAHTMMDGYQWVLTVAAHDRRHVHQIAEVKSAAGYPA